MFVIVFFFKQKTAYEMRISDWSSDVCSSDLRRLPTKASTDEAALENANIPVSTTPGLPPYETVALVLQGGGALGAYQAGVFQGLHEAGIELSCLSGISIGALNTAIIAGNSPEMRVPRQIGRAHV